MDDNNELTIYILQQLRYGVPEQTVRATLAQNGWPQPLVDRAFSMVMQAAPHQVPPQGDLAGPQAAYMQPAAELPAPAQPQQASAALPMPEEPQVQFPSTAQKKTRQRKSWLRPLIVGLIALVVLFAISFGAFMAYKALNHHNKPAKQTGISATQADNIRKQNISKLADDLSSYYSKYHSYPTLSDVNSTSFAVAQGAFDESKLHDPSWSAKKSQCTDKQGRAQLAANRSGDCFSYRVTARNGADCDASSKPCTRVVLTANLSNNKPYIVALDENIKE